MKPYAIIDLHCDTLTKSTENSLNNSNEFSIDKLPEKSHWAQFFAIFTDDNCKTPLKHLMKYYESFLYQMNKYRDKVLFCKSSNDLTNAWAENKCGCFLTVENGNVLEGNDKNIEVLANMGVKMLTLVWNGENEIGSGYVTNKGLTDFGKEIIPILEDNNIIIDVSHLNDNGFYDFLKIARKPFVASHSNVRTICKHNRNLTDEMIAETVKRNGLIGINYHTEFVCSNANDYGFHQLYEHIERLISLGAGNNIALGSDFDGGIMPDCLNDICKVNDLYIFLIKNKLTKEEADSVFYGNALRFINNNIK